MKSRYVVSIVAIMVAGTAFGALTIPATDRVGLATLEYVNSTVQEKITPGTTGKVVVYDDVNTTTGQQQFDGVAVFNGTNNYNLSTDYGTFITAGTIANVAATAETLTIPDTELVCANSPECSLWTKPAANATKSLFATGTFAPLTSAAPQCMVDGTPRCTSDSDCCNYCDDSGKESECSECKGTGAHCSSSTECCQKKEELVCLSKIGVCTSCLTYTEHCSAHSDCCSGFYCNMDNDKDPFCDQCISDGEKCGDDAMCCSGYCDENNYCGSLKCTPNGGTCGDDAECCSDYCEDKKCVEKKG